MKFSAERRVELLGLLAGGQPLGRACEMVGVSRWTVQRWERAGRAQDASQEQQDFARQLGLIHQARTNGHGGLAEGEAETLLAAAARRGNVSALTELRRREQTAERPEPEPAEDWPTTVRRWACEGDPFVGISPDELAELTREQQQDAVRVSEAHVTEGCARQRCGGRARR